MSKIQTVQVATLRHNPHRMMIDYPINQIKVDSLKRSISSIGLWESIIVRPASDGIGYEIAFGHHRVEALKQLKQKSCDVIIKDLTDQQMLEYMGRENGEDYNTEFLIMLNTWDGAVKFTREAGQKLQPTDIARILGWTRKHKGLEAMNDTATACASAHSLISGKHISHKDLTGLTVSSAKDICTRAATRIRQIDAKGAKAKRPIAEINLAKEHVGKAAKIVARKLKDPENKGVSTKNLTQQIDLEAFKEVKRSKTEDSPLFDIFGKKLAASIEKFLHADAAADKLAAIVGSIGDIQMEKDFKIIRAVDFQLEELVNRAENWRKRIIPQKVVDHPKMKALTGGKS